MSESDITLLKSVSESSTTSTETKPNYSQQKNDASSLWTSFCLAPALVSSIFAGLVVSFYVRFVQNWDLYASEQYFSYGNCNLKYSASVQRRFVLDLTFGNYKFADAKLIDIVWSSVVIQGGRYLHAYILFQHIVRRMLTLLMEDSSVTYEEFIALTLSQSFWGTMSFMVRAPFRRNKVSTWLCILGLAYLFLYVIAFQTIWETANGYISPAERAYRMPDNTYLPIDSEHLSLCWAIDSARLGLPPGHVEMGPDFSKLSTWLSAPSGPGVWEGFPYPINPTPRPSPHKGSLNLQKRIDRDLEMRDDVFFLGWQRTIWDDIGPAGLGLGFPATEISKEIFNYAFTSRTFHLIYNSTGENSTGYNTEIRLPEVTNSTTLETIMDTKKIAHNFPHLHSLSTTLHWKNFENAIGETASQNDSKLVEYFNTWPMLAYPVSYSLDELLQPGPGIIPYNSTFVFNSTTYQIEAPFLDIGYKCSNPFNYLTALGNCVCYDGVPLEYDWYQDQNVVCLDSPNFSWGFSSYVVFIGLICEGVWIVFYMWIRAYCLRYSKLLKHSRMKNSGVRWSILEVAEAMGRDLRDTTPLERERDIRKRLGKCKNIRYNIDQDEKGNFRGVYVVSANDTGDIEEGIGSKGG
ncbi:hypothetical protein BX600DRAFT_437940 [Xylariales sp. PMI_506]|nr:hypothetical protein BX600DRAFT_437940 [Xylariales sp. PMI_506]